MTSNEIDTASVQETQAPESAEKETRAEQPATPPQKAIDPHTMLTVSTSPHIKAPDTTRSIMIDVLIALLPSFIWGI